VECVRFWLAGFAPDEVRFSILKTLPNVQLGEADVNFLRCIYSSLKVLDWNGDKIHDTVYESTKSCAIGAKSGFQCLYQIFIDRKQGPRLGYFLSTLDKEFVLNRIEEAIRSAIPSSQDT
jgi:lysyl-tRNA synthetase class 1